MFICRSLGPDTTMALLGAYQSLRLAWMQWQCSYQKSTWPKWQFKHGASTQPSMATGISPINIDSCYSKTTETDMALVAAQSLSCQEPRCQQKSLRVCMGSVVVQPSNKTMTTCHILCVIFGANTDKGHKHKLRSQ